MNNEDTVQVGNIISTPNESSFSGYTKDEADKKFREASEKLAKADEKLIEAVKRIEKIDKVLFVVVIVLLVMVATLVIDSFHINSAIYKEYSEKTASVETTQKANEVSLKQIQDLSEQNKKNLEMIIELQKQLLKK